MTFLDGDRPVVKIHTDGSTEVVPRWFGKGGTTDVWAAGPTLGHDGSITINGAVVARLRSDGTIINPRTGEVAPVKITPDKVVYSKTEGHDVGITMSADGTLTLFGVPEIQLAVQVRGADTTAKRMTVLTLFVSLFFTPRHQ